jgi:2-dehydropantoate 2-reductase
VDNEEKIEAIVGPGHVAGGVAYIMATIGEPGVIVHEGAMARLVFGEMDGARSERLEALLALCQAASVDAELSEDIRVELWRKMAFICAVAGMTAGVRLPVGDLRRSEPALAMLARLAREVVAVAHGSGVALGEDIPDRVVDTVRALPADNFSSLHYDLTHGKPLELEALNGTVLRLARGLDLAVPANEAVYAILHPWALRNG